MKEDYVILMKFMGGTLENHPVSPGSTQVLYKEWHFRNGIYPTVPEWAVEQRMQFNNNWNLLMPVVNKLSEVVEPFTEEGAYRVTLYKHLCYCDIQEVYRYCVHIVKMLNDAKVKKIK